MLRPLAVIEMLSTKQCAGKCTVNNNNNKRKCKHLRILTAHNSQYTAYFIHCPQITGPFVMRMKHSIYMILGQTFWCPSFNDQRLKIYHGTIFVFRIREMSVPPHGPEDKNTSRPK